jgi:hypothetical protein
VAAAAVGLAGFAAGPLGLWLGRPLGERRGLALGVASRRVETGAGRVEFAAEALVLPAEALVLLAELLDSGAELPQLLQDGGGYGHRVEYLDGRHRSLPPHGRPATTA